MYAMSLVSVQFLKPPRWSLLSFLFLNIPKVLWLLSFSLSPLFISPFWPLTFPSFIHVYWVLHIVLYYRRMVTQPWNAWVFSFSYTYCTQMSGGLRTIIKVTLSGGLAEPGSKSNSVWLHSPCTFHSTWLPCRLKVIYSYRYPLNFTRSWFVTNL